MRISGSFAAEKYFQNDFVVFFVLAKWFSTSFLIYNFISTPTIKLDDQFPIDIGTKVAKIIQKCHLLLLNCRFSVNIAWLPCNNVLL